MPSPGTTTIDALPDALLGRVLALVGQEQGWVPRPWRLCAGRCLTQLCRCRALSSTASLPACRPVLNLVSRRWQRVFYAEPGLWRHLRLGACSLKPPPARKQWFAAKRTLAQRVSSLVTQASVVWDADATSGFTGLAMDVLRLLQPGMLTGLALTRSDSSWPRPQPLSDAAVRELPRFTGLTRLQLDGPLLPPSTAGALRQLPQLCSLACSAGSLPEARAAALVQLSVLRDLDLRCSELQPPAEAMLCVAVRRLPQLRSLRMRLDLDDSMPKQLVDSMAGLTQLTLLALSSQQCPTLQQLTRLTRLQHLHISQGGRSTPWQPPEPAAFTALQSYCFQSSAKHGELEVSL